MHLEHFHQELKPIYLEGKKSKRVDKCCNSLKRYILNKKYERLVKKHKGKITKRHTKSFKKRKEGIQNIYQCVQVDENKWNVQSKDGKNMYVVTKLHACDSSTYNLICRACFICYKSHTCTCMDFAIQYNICKHIRSVVMSYNNIIYIGPLQTLRKEVTVESVNQKIKKKTNDEQHYRKKILNKMYAVTQKTSESSSSISKPIADEVIKALSDIEKLLDIKQSVTKLPVVLRQEPSNKKTIPQRFFSTRKRRLTKPVSSEVSTMKSLLLQKKLYVSKDGNRDHDNS